MEDDEFPFQEIHLSSIPYLRLSFGSQIFANSDKYNRSILNDKASTYLGRTLLPIKYSSTDFAHWRPSRIAQTTSDCPRRISPAANTLGWLV